MNLKEIAKFFSIFVIVLFTIKCSKAPIEPLMMHSAINEARLESWDSSYPWPLPAANEAKTLGKRVIKNSKQLFAGGSKIRQPKSMMDFLLEAEELADSSARKILAMGRKMILEDKTILPGTCWTYMDALFKKAGFKKDRQVIHRGKKRGPYADVEEIQPGDWLYFINHSYRSTDHSAVFVYWVDRARKIAMTFSYGGQYKRKPGKYQAYNLKDVFFITRPGKKVKESRQLLSTL